MRDVELGIVSDRREMLAALIAQAGNGRPDRREWVAGSRAATTHPAPPAPSAADGLTPGLLAATLASSVPPDAICVDGGETPAWFDGFAASLKPGPMAGARLHGDHAGEGCRSRSARRRRIPTSA